MTDVRFWKKIKRSIPCLLTALAILSGCGGAAGNDRQQGTAGEASAWEEDDVPREPTGIMEPMAVFEKINLDMKTMDGNWFWTGEKLYYVERVGAGGALGNKILCASLDGTSEEVVYEREDCIFYHLFEGLDDRFCFMVGSGSGENRTYCLMQIDRQGQEITSFPIEEREIVDAPAAASRDAAMDAEGNIVLLGERLQGGSYAGDMVLYYFGADGAYLGKEETDITDAKLLDLGEGGVYLYGSLDGRSVLARVDSRAGKLGEAGELSVKRLSSGALGEYSVCSDPDEGILISESNALYRYDPVSGDTEKLLSWDAPEVGVLGTEVQGIRFGDTVGQTEDGSQARNVMALCNADRWSQREPELARVEFVDRAYIPRRQTVVLGTGNRTRFLDDAVRRFNSGSAEYRVILREYDTETMLDELLRDKKNVPDLLDLIQVDTEVLAAKGLLEDLEPYYAGSAIVRKEDILPAVWEAGMRYGKMREGTVAFLVKTLWCCDAELFHGGWGADELAELARQHSGTPLFSYNDSRWMLTEWLAGLEAEQFVDFEKCACSFDSPEFIGMLEKLKEVAATDSGTSESRRALLRGDFLVYEEMYFGPNSYEEALEDFTGKAKNIGYPFSGENRYIMEPVQQYGIFGLSERKEGAWAFLEYLLSEGEQLWYERDYLGFPARRDAMDIYLQQEYSSSDHAVKGKKKTLKEEAVGEMEDIFAHMRPWSRLATSDIKVILSEEIPYFWEGDKSAAEVAAVIQSRVQIYLRENM